MTRPPIPINSMARHMQPLRDTLVRCAGEVIDSGHFVLGPGVEAFERAFAAYCGMSHCVGLANGTDALELAIKAVGVASGDDVALTANAAMYGCSAVLACGAEPVFIDVEPSVATMDPVALATVLEANDRVRAVIVTHLYGRLARVEEIAALCKNRGVAIIEDCAQAHGAKGADGRVAGAYGDVACFSFYPTKNLGALGDGGAVVTANATTADRVRQLRQYGWSHKYTNELPAGCNSRLDEIQARMLSAMLPLLDGWNARRRQIANRYSAEINHPAIDVPPASGDSYVAHLYVVRSANRDSLRRHLASTGVHTDVHYPIPDHRQPCHAGRFEAVQLPVTEADARTVMTLPCFPEMDEDEVDHVIAACNAWQPT